MDKSSQGLTFRRCLQKHWARTFLCQSLTEFKTVIFLKSGNDAGKIQIN